MSYSSLYILHRIQTFVHHSRTRIASLAVALRHRSAEMRLQRAKNSCSGQQGHIRCSLSWLKLVLWLGIETVHWLNTNS